MKVIRKLFGEINLTWPKLIIIAVIAGIYTAVMAMLTIARDTSFSDIAVSFEVWILFGIIIIMNSKSAIDSALKCFVFFLISQPLVYLVQDIINHSELFATYYRLWIPWTVMCFPMGFVGYYMKKDKWWGILILAPMLLLLGDHYLTYLSRTMFSFPHHLLTTIFCIVTLLLYPIAIFTNKKARAIGIVISSLIIAFGTAICITNPPIYDTIILSSGGSERVYFDDTYNAYLEDNKYGDLIIKYEDGIEDYVINAKFKKAGHTRGIIEAPDGNKRIFDIDIKRDTYKLKF